MAEYIRTGRTAYVTVAQSPASALTLRISIVVLLVMLALTTGRAHGQENLLWNGNFDVAEAVDPSNSSRRWSGWRTCDTNNGVLEVNRSTTGSDSGNYHFATISPYFPEEAYSDVVLSQEIDLTDAYLGLDQTRLANGGYMVEYGGLQKSYGEWLFSPIDAGLISLSQGVYGQSDLGWQNSTLSWTESAGTHHITGTTPLTYSFTARRYDNHGGMYDNDAWLDNAYAYINENDIWSTGTSGSNIYGQGDRVIESDWYLPFRLYITNGATLTTQGEVVGYGDHYGNPTIVSIDNGQWHATGDVLLRDMEIDVTNGMWSTTGNEVVVGDRGTSTVTLGAGAVWAGSSAVKLGREYIANSDVQGSVNVAGGHWVQEGEVEVGAGRNGQVTVTNGGLWGANAAVRIGGTCEWGTDEITRGWGHVVIGDNDFNKTEYWATEGPVYVGGEGQGTVNIYGSGEWQSRNEVTIGGLRSGSVALRGGIWSASDTITVAPNGTISLVAGTLRVESQMDLTVNGNLTFEGGAIELCNNGSQLVTTFGDLALNGAEIFGDGRVYAGGYDIDLGSVDNPGRLAGYGAGEILSVAADITGSGAMEYVDLAGDIDVGSSPGVITLSHFTMSPGASILLGIEGIGDEDYDRLILGQEVSLAGLFIDMSFADGFLPGGIYEYQMISAIDGASLYDALSGASITIPDLCSFDMFTGVLTVTPEPVTAVMLLVGSATLLRRRRTV